MATEFDFISFCRIAAENLESEFGRNLIVVESLPFSFGQNQSRKCLDTVR